MTTWLAQFVARRGTAAEWTTANTVLMAGEMGFETDTGKHKIGDGTTAWSGLPYFLNENSVGAATQTALGTKLTAASNLSDLANAATSRTNLGLGDAATHPASDFLTPTQANGTYAPISGATIAAASAWASGVGYLTGAIVTYANSVYQAASGSTGVAPGSDPTKWTLLIAGSKSGLVVPAVRLTTSPPPITGTPIITLMTVAPTTVDPITLDVKIDYIKVTGTAAGTILANLGIMDDLGTVLTSTQYGAGGAAANYTQALPLRLTAEVTPGSTDRTYHLYANTTLSTTTLTINASGGTCEMTARYAA